MSNSAKLQFIFATTAYTWGGNNSAKLYFNLATTAEKWGGCPFVFLIHIAGKVLSLHAELGSVFICIGAYKVFGNK